MDKTVISSPYLSTSDWYGLLTMVGGVRWLQSNWWRPERGEIDSTLEADSKVPPSWPPFSQCVTQCPGPVCFNP